MSLSFDILPYTLQFKQPAGTSRGTYRERKIWIIKLYDVNSPMHTGMGECAPLPNLSCDWLENYEDILASVCKQYCQTMILDYEALRPYPSMLFGLESAIRHFKQQSNILWDTPFAHGKAGIPINGLIWMGKAPEMLKQIEKKMESGFRCIKLKIGAINFEEEINLLKHIRHHFSAKEIELRVDANGAFTPKDVLDKLKCLADLEIHSIEQPIRAGQWQAMAQLCSQSPLSIALDEELIGIHDPSEKKKLLETIKPQYIILKPSLHGGINGSIEWIEYAKYFNIGWWITSALESNIGLNTIAQWTASLQPTLPQGLGTGMLYTNNIDTSLYIKRDELWIK